MKSDFSAARIHLDRAYHYLRGDDGISRRACHAIDELLELVIIADSRQNQSAKVLRFPVSLRGSHSIVPASDS